MVLDTHARMLQDKSCVRFSCALVIKGNAHRQGCVNATGAKDDKDVSGSFVLYDCTQHKHDTSDERGNAGVEGPFFATVRAECVGKREESRDDIDRDCHVLSASSCIAQVDGQGWNEVTAMSC